MGWMMTGFVDFPVGFWAGLGVGLLVTAVVALLVYGVTGRKYTAQMQVLEQAAEKNRAEMEEEREQEKTAFEEMNRTRAANELFFSTMSHELRTPLNAILGFTKILQGETSLDADQRESLAKIRQGGETLLLLVDNLLAFARIEIDDTFEERKEFPLRKVEDDLRETVFYLLREKKLSLAFRMLDDNDFLIRTDVVKFKLLVANLVAFAAGLTSPGEELILHFHQTDEPLPGRETKGLRLELHWVGESWPETQWEQAGRWLKEPAADQQLRHSSQILTISIIQALLRQLEGTPTAVSRSGGGEVHFNLGIPTTILRSGSKAAAPRLPSLYKEALAETSYHCNVLVVEDDPTNRAVIQMMLKKMGHQCVLAENGELGLEALREDDFDVILMDIDMPVMNGMETTKAVREGRAGAAKQNIPIVTLTAFAVPREKEKYLSLGFDYFLTKPVNPDALRGVLSEILNQRKNLTS